MLNFWTLMFLKIFNWKKLDFGLWKRSLVVEKGHKTPESLVLKNSPKI